MRAKPTDFTEAPIDSIGIGSVVELNDLGSERRSNILSLVHGTVIRKTIFSPTSLHSVKASLAKKLEMKFR